MSVTECNPINVTYRDPDGRRVYTVEYESKTNDSQDHAGVVVVDLISRVPFGTPYSLGNESDPWAFANWPKSCKKRGKRSTLTVWSTLIDFSLLEVQRCSQLRIENPVDQPYKVSGSFVRAMKAVTEDRNGVPITNSSDEPVLPAPEVRDSADTVVVEVNTATINLPLRAQMRDRVNNATLWGLAKRTVRLAQWTWLFGFYGLCAAYVINRLEFEINLNTWDFKHTDQGFRIKNGTDESGKTKYTTLMDDRDQPLRHPRLLDGSGALLADSGTPVELTDELDDEGNFMLLPIPNPLF